MCEEEIKMELMPRSRYHQVEKALKESIQWQCVLQPCVPVYIFMDKRDQKIRGYLLSDSPVVTKIHFPATYPPSPFTSEPSEAKVVKLNGDSRVDQFSFLRSKEDKCARCGNE